MAVTVNKISLQIITRLVPEGWSIPYELKYEGET